MNLVRSFTKNRLFFTTLLALGLPIALQNLISSCLNMVDTVMIGRLGETELAAVGLANQVFFFYLVFAFGICSGTNVFIAQYWGKGDITSIRRVNGLGTMLSLGLSAIFLFAATLFPEQIMQIYSKDPEVIRQGALFMRITALAYPLFGVNQSFSFAMRGIGQPRTPMIIGSIALTVNTVLNFLLIFGSLGFPKMGVAGTATATLIARIVEFSLTIGYVYGRKTVLAAGLSDLICHSRSFVVQYLKNAGPVIANEGLWSLAMTLVMVAYSKLGTQSVAAVQISNTIQNLFFVVIFGVSNAAAIMVGNKVGAGERDEALRYSSLSMQTAVLLGVVMGGLIFISSPLILMVFKVAPDTREITLAVLRVMSAVTLLRFINIVIIVGVLRGGGDTRFSLIIDVGALWLIGLPLAFLGATLWHLPIYTVIAIVAVEEVVKAAAGLYRLKTGGWVKDVTVATS